jgi:hypothetical protein
MSKIRLIFRPLPNKAYFLPAALLLDGIQFPASDDNFQHLLSLVRDLRDPTAMSQFKAHKDLGDVGD